jgi:hypothetical protein
LNESKAAMPDLHGSTQLYLLGNESAAAFLMLFITFLQQFV